MAYKRNNEGKFVDESGALVFSNDIFNQLLVGDHNYVFTPNNMYVSTQVEKVFIPNVDDTRKYVDIVCSKLMDDNGSLATDNTRELYTKDVKSFMAIVNKICDTAPEDVKNKILGGNFATKDDADPKYAVPLYLCSEILKAKWNSEYQNTPSETWELFNTDDNVFINGQVKKESTLGAQMDTVIEKLKSVDYDKDYFASDMSRESSDYVAACQFDSTNSIDIYAECQPESCELYATNGVQTYNISMFKVEKKQENVAVPLANDMVAPVMPESVGLVETTGIGSTLSVGEEISTPVLGNSINSQEVSTSIEQPVNIITDSNDVAQSNSDVNTLNADIISPSIPMENSDIFNNVGTVSESAPVESADISVSTNSKYEELMKLREELRKAQAAYDEAFDAYVEQENAPKSMAA